ncbi:MAG: hypothetical protein AAGF84_12665 [Planctomycetota bacterium]
MRFSLMSRLTAPPRRGRLALIAAAAVAVPLLMPAGAAPAASAGETRWSVTVGHHSGGHYDRKYSSRHHRSHYSGHSGGYYKQVWVPPVYRTRYDDCGRAFRVCIRHGYYKQVYVRTQYQPRYRDYHRRGQWGNRGSCRY